MRLNNTVIEKVNDIVIVINGDGDNLNEHTVEKYASLERVGDSSIYSNDYFKVDISKWDPNYDLVLNNNGTHVSNAISKYITSCLRFLHLDLTSRSEHLTFIGRQRMKEEAKAVKEQIDALGKLSFFGSHLTMAMIKIVGERVNLFTHEPIFSALENLEPFSPDRIDPYYRLEFKVVPEALELVKARVSELVDAEIAKIQTKIEQSASMCFAINIVNQAIRLDSKLVEYLCMNRHLLSTCPDLLFNALLLKSEYSSDDLFGKGLALKMKLLELSTRYKFNKTAISKRSFYSSFDDIVSDVYSIDFKTGIEINDFEHYKISEKRAGFDLVVSSLTMTSILGYVLKYPNSSIEGGVLSVTDGKGLIFKVDLGKPEITIDKLIQLSKVCMQLTLVTFCKISINTLHETTFEAKVLDLLDRSGFNIDA